ncbi:MAG: FliM/FliN family flagellar motor switch protein [Pseudomonadota bacterium]
MSDIEGIDDEEDQPIDDLVFMDDHQDADGALSLPEADEGEISASTLEEFAEDLDASDTKIRESDLKKSIFSVPIVVTVTVGSARPLIGELLSMGRDHLLPLDSNIDDPVELRVKDRVIARGELTQVDEDSGRLGIRLTEIVEAGDLTL